MVPERLGPSQRPIERDRREGQRPVDGGDLVFGKQRLQGRLRDLRIAHDVEPIVHGELVSQRIAVDQRRRGKQYSDKQTILHGRPFTLHS